MVRDLSDPYARSREQRRAQRRIHSGTPQQNAAVDRGAFTVKSKEGLFVGTPTNPSGSQVVYGTLTIVGTLNGDGTLSWDGTLIGSGQLLWSGPWEFAGDGDISGALNVVGPWEMTGPGKIVGTLDVTGQWKLTGNGQILGNVVVGAGGKVTAGSVVLNPAGGGSLDFGNGARILANAGSAGIKLESGSGWTGYVARHGVRFAGAIGEASFTMLPESINLGADAITLSADDLSLSVPTIAVTDVTHWLGKKADGTVGWVAKGTGGPMGSGEFRWPFPIATTPVTREFGPHPAYDDGLHKGIDFGVPAGTPIPAPADGTVLTKGFDAQRGNFIILSHGDRGAGELTTRQYHLQVPSPLAIDAAVTGGQIIGTVGWTGMVEPPGPGGAHSHYETRIGDTPINPRQFMLMYGE